MCDKFISQEFVDLESILYAIIKYVGRCIASLNLLIRKQTTTLQYSLMRLILKTDNNSLFFKENLKNHYMVIIAKNHYIIPVVNCEFNEDLESK